jgi:predicted nucleic acid-binding protein
MPRAYADSSVLFAYFYPRDTFNNSVSAATQQHAPDFIYWPWLRFELRHNLRLVRSESYGETAWRALSAAEKTSARLRWHGELHPETILDAAEELSAKQAGNFDCGSGDYLHVAAARRLREEIDEFWTCDAIQAKLARAEGLSVRLFK